MIDSMSTTDFPLLVRVPDILGGKLSLKGTRVPVWLILQILSAGDSFETIIASYPSVTREHLNQVVAFAARHALAEMPQSDLPAEAV
jgi:uncharacterized protein (DUF433 family)